MDKVKVIKDLDNKTLVIERVFNAPRDRVWNAFTDPDIFVKWWGPEGWDTVVKEFNLIDGGRNHYGMRCVDESQGEWFGQESWGVMIFESVNAPSSFTYKDYFSDSDGTLNTDMPVLTIKNEFLEEGTGTRMVSTSLAGSAEEINKLIDMGMIEGYSTSMDKLDRVLAQ